MIEFILNDTLIKTKSSQGGTLLDFVRYESSLVGTKIGCREGDCGACTVLIGELNEGSVAYSSITSCISPLGNSHGKHIVTIEGINQKKGLRPFQQAMVDESASQCGFCTVGFVMSLAGECLSDNEVSAQSFIDAMDGNICRCTGYKSIERAASQIADDLISKGKENTIQWLIENGYVPDYFEDIQRRLNSILPLNGEVGKMTVGGGTDLLVQRHDDIFESDIHLVSKSRPEKSIYREEDVIIIHGSTNTTELMESTIMRGMIPNFLLFLKLVSSTPIRNMGTIAGNLINASPIGDLTALFLALNATVHLNDSWGTIRDVKLKDFYLGYKKMDIREHEMLNHISFNILSEKSFFNFEKISKRKYLDIATVNTALQLKLDNEIIEDVYASAGGVGPVPIYLKSTCEYLRGKELHFQNVLNSLDIINTEISPISDVRGTKTYKSFLLRQLFYGHFIELFPEKFNINQLIQ